MSNPAFPPLSTDLLGGLAQALLTGGVRVVDEPSASGERGSGLGQSQQGQVFGHSGLFSHGQLRARRGKAWRFAGLLSLPQDCHGTVTKTF